MKSFVFITHFTPAFKLSLLRKRLQEIYFKALNAQSYFNWKVLIIGEKEFEDQHFKFVNLNSNQSRENVLSDMVKIYDRKDVIEWITNSDYLIKLDDDDIISPRILDKVQSRNFDVYFDEYHTFYDITSGQIARQKRAWIASTCIHKTEHALSPVNSDRKNVYSNSLLYTDHSKSWFPYYSGKNILTAGRSEPVYLRVLSPTTRSASAKSFPITIHDINFAHYYQYLHSFGNWKEMEKLHDFDLFTNDLKSCWKEFSGEGCRQLPAKNFLRTLKDKLFYFIF